MDKQKNKKLMVLLFLLYGSFTSIHFLQNSISYETEIPIYKPSTQFQPKKAINNDVSIGEGVMLQGYYWLSPEGDWWNTVSNYIPEFAEVGFDAIWLPPVSKGASFTGVSSMGYEPYDYYDLGEFNQRGGVRTRFGTVEELDSLITNAHANGIALIADLVLNHNNGGDSEYNPNTFTNTLTDFSGVASGIFPRNYSCFHPCDFAVDDEGSFAIFPDLCHDNPYVQSEFIKWGKWLMNEVGFDGWRFDYVKGFSPTVVENWMVEVGQWGVAEFWDGNKELVKDYMVSAGNTVNAFDFPLLYRLHDMCDSHGLFDLGRLAYDNGLLGDIPEKSVTFVSNHDTTRDENSNIEYNKHLAYAYILTHEGYPSVFWRDYFNLYYHDHIQALVQIHNNYAKGETENLYATNDVYVAQRNGDPGLIVAINDNPTMPLTVPITTKWVDQTLFEATGHGSDIMVDSNGEVEITIPANDYLIYLPVEQRFNLTYIVDDSDPFISKSVDSKAVNFKEGLSDLWGYPSLVDPAADTKGKPQDLTYLYLNNDNDFLYIGFPYQENIWTEGENLQFGIALDTQPGGANFGPKVHESISYTGDNLPEYLYYLETDVDSSPSNLLQNTTRFSYQNEIWDSGVAIDNDFYSSNETFKFAELKIPLSDVDLNGGGNISIVVFSTQVGKPGAADSIPSNDRTFDYGEGETWLVLSDQMNVLVTKKNTDTFWSSIPGFDLQNIFIFSLVGIAIIRSKVIYKRKFMDY